MFCFTLLVQHNKKAKVLILNTSTSEAELETLNYFSFFVLAQRYPFIIEEIKAFWLNFDAKAAATLIADNEIRAVCKFAIVFRAV